MDLFCLAADITPHIKQLKRRSVQTTVVFKKGNRKFTHKSSYQMKDFFSET